MFLLDRIRRRKPAREEAGREPYLPPDLERFRMGAGPEAPERERKFRSFARDMENPEAIGMGLEERRENIMQKPADGDKIDMILQKLETIDLRLKVIDQKLERRPV
jgi:hypothetical protein